MSRLVGVVLAVVVAASSANAGQVCSWFMACPPPTPSHCTDSSAPGSAALDAPDCCAVAGPATPQSPFTVQVTSVDMGRGIEAATAPEIVPDIARHTATWIDAPASPPPVPIYLKQHALLI